MRPTAQGDELRFPASAGVPKKAWKQKSACRFVGRRFSNWERPTSASTARHPSSCTRARFTGKCPCQRAALPRKFEAAAVDPLGARESRGTLEDSPLPHTQAASTTFLAAAANAAHRAFAGAAVAIKDAFLDAPAERMRLGLEHLRRTRKPKAPPVPTYEMRVADLIDAYADPTLPPDCENIARAIAGKAYRSGCCYATQEKIATWTRLPRATLQLRLHEMERRNLIHVQRRISTSSITLLADGTLDALRLKRINKIKVRERVAPEVIRTFTAKTPPNPHQAGVSGRQKVNSWPKDTTCPNPQIATQSIGKNDGRVCAFVPPPVVSAKSSPHVTPEVISPAPVREKSPVTTSKKAEKVHPKTSEKPQENPSAVSVTEKSTTHQNGKEETKKAAPTSISSHLEHPTAADALIAEGVTPARARDFASLFEPERIARTIALGIHRTKTNPPGYLLRLIQDDAASKRVAPGSEADRVRKRERPAVLRGKITHTEAVEAREPVAPRVSSSQTAPSALGAIYGTFSEASEPPAGVEDPLETLPPEDRDYYARRAREEVLRANPWLSAAVRERNGPMMQTLIRKRLQAITAAEAPASRGAPAG
jgi:hypothetical protein